MRDRLYSPRWIRAILCAGVMLAAPFAGFAGDDTAHDGPQLGTKAPGRSVFSDTVDAEPIRVQTFPRTVAWWPFRTGPSYGDVRVPGKETPSDVIITSVGAFRMGDTLPFPAELTGNLSGLAQGYAQYFVVTLRDTAPTDAARIELTSMGAEIMYPVPKKSLLVRANQAAYDMMSTSPYVEHVEPWHPAFKIDPSVGRQPQLSAEAAASPMVDLAISLFPGEDAASTAKLIQALGGNVTWASHNTQAVQLYVTAHVSRVPELAKLEPIRSIAERGVSVLLGARGALNIQNNSGLFGDFPYWEVGIDGDGQVAHVTDSGLSVDAGDFSDTRADSGWDDAAACKVIAGHRKVLCYQRANAYGGSGDFLACDTPANGGSHGQVVSSIAVGNATRGAVPAPSNPSPTDDQNPNDYGDGFYSDNDSNGMFDELNDGAFDGVAKGAQIVFVDANNDCSSGGIASGNLESAITSTWNDYRATDHNFSFGSTNPLGPQYSPDAADIDSAIVANPANLVFVAAGNDGTTSDTGSSAEVGKIGDQASCKNCVPVGISFGVGGAMGSATSPGPAQNGRVSPLLLAEGQDNACRSLNETPPGDENQTGEATCSDSGWQIGTSMASPNAMGAALLVRSYFAQGFYPDFSDQNTNNDSEKIKFIDSSLVKSILICGAEPITSGKNLIGQNAQDRFNNLWGYGRIQIDKSLPLAADPDTRSGLVVHSNNTVDLDGDGTTDNVSSLSLPATLAPNQSASVEFEVLDDTEDLSIVLSWIDDVDGSNSGVLVNDLDLEVRYCGADAVCGNGDDRIYLGNAFAEDADRDQGVIDIDLDGDDSFDGYWYSIDKATGDAGTPANQYDTTYDDDTNNTEAVWIPEVNSPRNDRDEDGTQDLPELVTGTWQLTVRSEATSLTTVNYYSIAICGPVQAGSSVRFDTNPLVCNADVSVIVTETEDPNDPDCKTPANCSAALIDSRLSVEVLDEADVVVDTNTTNVVKDGLRFESQRFPLTTVASPVDDGILSVQHGYSLRVTYADVDADGSQDRISTAIVDCKPEITVGEMAQLGPDASYLLSGGCDDDRYLDQGEVFSISMRVANIDPIDLIDAQLTLRAVVPDNDDDADPCRRNNTTHPNIQVLNGVQQDTQEQVGLDPGAGGLTLRLLPTQTFNTTAFAIEVVGDPADRDEAEFVVGLSGAKTGQQEEDCFAFQLLLDADDEEFLYSTDCPTGCTLDYDRNNDEKYEAIIAEDPFNPLSFVLEGLSETNVVYSDMTAAADEDGNGTADCDQAEPPGVDYICGNPGFNGPWDFDSDDEGYRSGHYAENVNVGLTPITLWGEDSNWNGTLDPGEDQGGTAGLDQNWGTGGGCGWMTANGTSRGIWHTGTIGNWAAGHATTSCVGQDNICEEYDTNDGTNGNEIWVEFLRTPEIHPVHFGSDPRPGDGFDWRTQITDFSWNFQVDVEESSGSAFTWELDLNTSTADPTVLGDGFIQFLFPSGASYGLYSGGQIDLFDGALAFAPTDPGDTSNPTDGDETNGTVGGNRAGRRGCYFNDLNSLPGDGEGLTAGTRIVSLPYPDDDDCDNDVNDLGDGCPGLCGVDDDGNGIVDDQGEICRCRVCDVGSIREGQACTNDAFCNETGDAIKCVFASGTGNLAVALGDDSCGDGSVDEGVAAEFGTHTSLRQVRNMDVNKLNRNFFFNTFEDLYKPVGTTWQAEIGFLTREGDGELPLSSYGVSVDDLVIEWKEVHPVDQTYTVGGACDVTDTPRYDGRCASIQLGSSTNTYDGDTTVAVSVLDPTATEGSGDPNLVDCNGDGTINEVEILAFSEAEREAETLCLERREAGSILFEGLATTTTRVNAQGDKLIFLAFNGFDNPSLTVRYIDKWDGVNGTDNGPDGAPGIVNFDDDGDGTIDNIEELCPVKTQLAPGRSPHSPGRAARFSDDNCGCPTNPLQDIVLASFDVIDLNLAKVYVDDSATGDGGGDGDGWADRGEEITLDILLRNLSDVPLRDIELFLVTRSPHIEGMFDDRIFIDSMAAKGQGATDSIDTRNGSDHFRLKVGSPVRNSVEEDLFSEFKIIIRGVVVATEPGAPDVPFSGSVFEQTFRLEHNLNASGAGTPSDFFDNFEDYTGTTTLPSPITDAWEFYNSGDDLVELDDNRCQYNDPGNPASNNTGPGTYCELGASYSNTENHWHLHSPVGDGCEGSSCPEGFGAGRSWNGDGIPGNERASLHLGNHVDAPFVPGLSDGTTYDMNRMRWAETANSIQLGTGEVEWSYFTQMSISDGRLFGLAGSIAMDAALTYVCVDHDGDNGCDSTETNAWNGTGTYDPGTEQWTPVRAWYSPETQQRIPNFINCSYDPTDDGNTEDDLFLGEDDIGPSSTCFPANTSATCVGATTNEDPSGLTLRILNSTCFPETGLLSEGMTGETPVQGLWIEKKIDLREYRGRRVLLRYHVSPLEVKGVPNCGDILGLGCFNRDDGWFIDDVRVTGAVATGSLTLSVDSTDRGTEPLPVDKVTGLTMVLQAVPVPNNDKNGNPKANWACDWATGGVQQGADLAHCDRNGNGTLDEDGDGTLDEDAEGDSDANGRAITLDGSESSYTTCLEGDLEWRFEDDSSGTMTVIRDWLSDPRYLDNPGVDTNIRGCVRCTSDLSVVECVDISINVPIDFADCYPRDPGAAPGQEGFHWPNAPGDKSIYTWQWDPSNACPQAADIQRGDVRSMKAGGDANGGDFSNTGSNATCLSPVDGSDTTNNDNSDAEVPNAGEAFYYLVRIDGFSYNTHNGSQTGSRDTTAEACGAN